ncbi:MAG TPA: hypothetical protein DCS80_01545 [Betaproteobacteria bacterium]|nr:hypothetical protein [Betaproteobacteria bacterium]
MTNFLIQAKSILRSKLRPRVHLGLKSLLKPSHFDEVDLVYKVLSEEIQSKVMIDVGAHYGESLHYFINDHWRVHAFEPDAKNRAVLLALASQNDLLTVNPEGCSDKIAQDVPFFNSEKSTGISSLSAFSASHELSDTISTTTLAQYINNNQLPSVGFLKIDTEGHDLFVLKGFPWSLIQPEVIVAEFEDSKSASLGYDYKQMGDYLLSHGYTVLLSEWYPIIEYGRQHRWRGLYSYPSNLVDSFGWGNFIATKDPKHAARLLARV